MGVESVDELRVFAQIVDSGSLSEAARTLGVAPNYVSRRLSRLEERLGVTLIRRTTRQLGVTEEGERFYTHAREILDRVAAAEQELSPSDGRLRGLVRLQVPSLMTQFGLVDGLHGLLDQHPELSVDVLVVDEPVDLMARGCDLGIHVGRPADSSLSVKKIGTLVPWLAAAPKYLDSAGRPSTLQDLASHACLLFSGAAKPARWELVDAAGNTQTVTVSGRLSSNDSRALRAALQSGVGIGLMSGPDLRAAIEAGGLERVLPQYRFPTMEVFALSPPGRMRTDRVRAVLDLLGGFVHG